MKTEFTPEQIAVLAKAVHEARGGKVFWIPADCARNTCLYNYRDGRCSLNDCERQRCNAWQRPEDMPTPANVACLIALVMVLATAAVFVAMWKG